MTETKKKKWPVLVRGLLGTGPPDATLESASPSPPQGPISHQLNIDSTLIRHQFPDLTLSRCRINVESMLNRCQIDPWGGEGDADSRVGSRGLVPNKPFTNPSPFVASLLLRLCVGASWRAFLFKFFCRATPNQYDISLFENSYRATDPQSPKIPQQQKRKFPKP